MTQPLPDRSDLERGIALEEDTITKVYVAGEWWSVKRQPRAVRTYDGWASIEVDRSSTTLIVREADVVAIQASFKS